MTLTRVEVQTCVTIDEKVLVKADAAKTRVVAEINRVDIDDYFNGRLDDQEAISVVQRNIELIKEAMAVTYKKGQGTIKNQSGSSIYLLHFNLSDFPSGMKR